MNAPKFSIVIGNIGTLWIDDPQEAQRIYDAAVVDSKTGFGRQAGEPVTLMDGDTILAEYQPPEYEKVI